MESFLDMTLDRNLYIGVPVGAFLQHHRRLP